MAPAGWKGGTPSGWHSEARKVKKWAGVLGAVSNVAPRCPAGSAQGSGWLAARKERAISRAQRRRSLRWAASVSGALLPGAKGGLAWLDRSPHRTASGFGLGNNGFLAPPHASSLICAK